ncbi:hypothetical protein IWQ61_005440 [Dispira simplex]|nr:hypothetical protein IWQ61_005440 [Dispira simplex]
MGGHGPELLKHDPAFERWQTMREKTHEHFRPTPRNMRTGILAFVLIPALAFYVASKTFWETTRRTRVAT